MTVQVTPFIMLDGKAEEAIQFYTKALGAQVLFKQTFAEAPESSGLPANAKERVAHSVLKIGESQLFVADTFPGQFLQSGNQVAVCITVGEAGTSRQLFEALQQGGQVVTPLDETYFSPAYGEVTDKFGVTFQIFTERPS